MEGLCAGCQWCSRAITSFNPHGSLAISTIIPLGQMSTLRLWKMGVPEVTPLTSARECAHAQTGLAPSICPMYCELISNKHQVEHIKYKRQVC